MPLIFDMPLRELHAYQGSSPRPADVNEFWDRSLAEMRALDPQVELQPARFQAPYAECYDLYFTGLGGARVHAKFLRPRAQSKPGPAVLVFHGYSGDSGDWSSKLPYVAAGFTVAALDCRGQAGLSQDVGGVTGVTLRGHIIRGVDDGPDKLYYRHVFADTAQLAYIVMGMPGVDARRVGAFGGSQGGGLTLACAGLVPELKQAAPVFPFLSDYRRVWNLDLCENAYVEIREYFRWRDPTHVNEETFWNRLGYVDVQNLAPRIRAEVYMSVGLMDKICPPSTQFAAYNKITAPKRLEIYPDFAHEDLKGHQDRIFEFMLGMCS
jgi:cephalosporin-C deacetylase